MSIFYHCKGLEAETKPRDYFMQARGPGPALLGPVLSVSQGWSQVASSAGGSNKERSALKVFQVVARIHFLVAWEPRPLGPCWVLSGDHRQLLQAASRSLHTSKLSDLGKDPVSFKVSPE